MFYIVLCSFYLQIFITITEPDTKRKSRPKFTSNVLSDQKLLRSIARVSFSRGYAGKDNRYICQMRVVWGL